MSTETGRFVAPVRGLIKICGLSTPEAVEASVRVGADMVGLVFFSRSPRHVTYHRAAELAALARRLSPTVAVVALTVDATDAELSTISQSIAPDWFQLHGRESPARAALVRGQFDAQVMKAIGIGAPDDIAEAARYRVVADGLLLDAKPAPDAVLPGGNGVPFDHRLIAGQRFGLPFLLSGGLTPDNVAEAIALTSPGGVDVSSGVESAPGVKDIARIEAFVRAAREALDTARQ